MRRHPFELSGGMCQRVGIALAICHQPRLLIADEPTSSLDPTLQAQVLDLLRRMQRKHGLALLLISHDLALVSSVADRVAVMYHGGMAEFGSASKVFANPEHPYTRGLLRSQPSLSHHHERAPLAPISGSPPALSQILPGCSFAMRCSFAEPGCSAELPALIRLSEDHWAACIRAGARQENGRDPG
jgi:peptide/nickel transport system ATP-binding protein